ncbi:hypothetical protein ACOSP6_00065 [Tenacibaculum sp. MEBiC06402]|uniref:hypothetical protein n=1 Tax=unclassified Tenacibaculum TaxID=2635139 RepID=UPI003B9BE8DA
MKYRTNKYLTLKGKIEELSLPDSAYGEWIIYDNNKPKFHVNISNYESKSDCLISLILTENKSEFKNILNDINKRFNRNLTLPSKTFFGIKLNSKLRESDLDTLPFKYIDHYTELIKAPWEKYPGINPDDMFWRMGKGENAISTFVRYYNSLNQKEKDYFENKHKPIVEWTNFYE